MAHQLLVLQGVSRPPPAPPRAVHVTSSDPHALRGCPCRRFEKYSIKVSSVDLPEHVAACGLRLL